MLTIFLSVILLAFLFLGYCTHLYQKWCHLPPGPLPIPFVGHSPLILLAVKLGYSDIMRRTQSRYGDVFTLWNGNTPVVHIADYKTAQDALERQSSCLRERPDFLKQAIIREGRGLLFSNGNHHHEQRQFAISVLSHFGRGQAFESIIMEGLERSCNYLDFEKGVAGSSVSIDLEPIFHTFTGNALNKLLFSERFPREREGIFEEMKTLLSTAMEPSWADSYMTWWNCWLPSFRERHKVIEESLENLSFILKLQLEERIARVADGERDVVEDAEDVVDAYLQQQLDNTEVGIFNEESLVITLMDYWFAGQHSTTSMLYWAFAYLTLNPPEIESIQSELDRVTSRSCSLLLSDRSRTPTLNSIISEILRLSSVHPQTNRRVVKEVVVGGHRLETGTAVAIQLHLISTDPRTFDKPLEFKPTRFIANPALRQQISSFGFGGRSCIGDKMVLDILYLIIGNLLLCYNVIADPKNCPKMEARDELNSLRRTRPYKVYVSHRAPLYTYVAPK